MNAKLDDLFARWDANKLDLTRHDVIEWLRSDKAQRLLRERGYIRTADVLEDIPHFPSEELSLKHAVARALTDLGWRKTKVSGTDHRNCYKRPVQSFPW